MKKIALSLLLGTALVACKNDKELKYENNKSPQDSLTVVKEEIAEEPTSTKELVEYTPEKLTQLLSVKSNDTLYVTNFFATWCQPCMVEIPHFKEKMNEMKGKPIKFTFVSLDNKSDWATSVTNFADEFHLRDHILLLDGAGLDHEFFKKNFETWTGDAIPFTIMRRGNMVDEYMGSMQKEEINSKIDKMMKANFTHGSNEQKEKSKITGIK